MPIEKKLILKSTVILDGVEIGTSETAINSDVLGFKRERAFQLEHSFQKPCERAIQEALSNYDGTQGEAHK